MQHIKAFFIGVALAVLAGCASFGNINSAEAQRAVFGMKEAYKAALQQAVKYESQPRCSATVTAQCSKPEVVAQLRKADKVADAALDAAEAAVRSPDIGNDAMSKSMQTANAALAALSALLPLIGVLQ
jgi:hypothetical protein